MEVEMTGLHHLRDFHLVGGGICKSISWNDESVFQAKVIVVMLVHDKDITRAVDSVLRQNTEASFCLLIIDDSHTDDWMRYLDNRMNDSRITDVEQAGHRRRRTGRQNRVLETE